MSTVDEVREASKQFYAALNSMLSGKAGSMSDIWSHNPYTSGAPTHQAFGADNVSINELPKMRSLLQAAEAAHHTTSSGPVP